MIEIVEHTLRQGLNELVPDIDEGQIALLVDFLHELDRWNRAYNLTAIRDIDEMVSKHILDSLSVLPWLSDGPVLDVGTGAGLPGIPLAICRPYCEIALLDSNAKKTRFIRYVLPLLGIENAEVRQSRVELYGPDNLYSTVISRAFAAPDEFVKVAGHLCAMEGKLLAMTGRESKNIKLPEDFSVTGVHRLAVPGLDAERHLVEICRLA